ncbi:MAG: hypothetical protein PVH77_00640 [Phycisphaerales bacterium]|jgi:hypothetical protein
MRNKRAPAVRSAITTKKAGAQNQHDISIKVILNVATVGLDYPARPSTIQTRPPKNKPAVIRTETIIRELTTV